MDSNRYSLNTSSVDMEDRDTVTPWTEAEEGERTTFSQLKMRYREVADDVKRLKNIISGFTPRHVDNENMIQHIWSVNKAEMTSTKQEAGQCRELEKQVATYVNDVTHWRDKEEGSRGTHAVEIKLNSELSVEKKRLEAKETRLRERERRTIRDHLLLEEVDALERAKREEVIKRTALKQQLDKRKEREAALLRQFHQTCSYNDPRLRTNVQYHSVVDRTRSVHTYHAALPTINGGTSNGYVPAPPSIPPTHNHPRYHGYVTEDGLYNRHLPPVLNICGQRYTKSMSPYGPPSNTDVSLAHRHSNRPVSKCSDEEETYFVERYYQGALNDKRTLTPRTPKKSSSGELKLPKIPTSPKPSKSKNSFLSLCKKIKSKITFF